MVKFIRWVYWWWTQTDSTSHHIHRIITSEEKHINKSVQSIQGEILIYSACGENLFRKKFHMTSELSGELRTFLC